MKIAFIGGHLSPALAVIQQAPKDWECMYIGRKHPMEGDSAVSLEYQTMDSLGIPFVEFTTGRVQRKLTRHTFPSLLKLPRGFWRAYVLLRRVKPDVLVGFGGYVQVPLCFAAKALGIPVILHEQTLEAGLANKVCASLADVICVSWESSRAFFPKKKVVLTGNPMVQHEKTGDIDKYRRIDKKIPLIVIVGGSQGSHAINVLIEATVPWLIEQAQIIHQTGDASQFHDYERLMKLRDEIPEQLQERYLPVKFIAPGDIESVFEEADLVISRAGVNTVTQLLLLHKHSLIIPLSVSQHNEQWKNGMLLKKAGLAEIFKQEELTPDRLLSAIHAMLKNKTSYTNRENSSIRKLHAHASEHVLEVIQVYAKKARRHTQAQTS